MPSIEDIADVVVTSGSRPIDTASFSNALFIASHNVFTERSRVYTSSADAITDGFDSDSPVAKFLSGCFSGSQAPNSVIVGRRELDSIDIQVLSASEDEVYTATVKVGSVITPVSYTALVTDDVDDVATALQGLIDAVAGVTATVATDTVTATPDTLASEFSLYGFTDNLAITYVGNPAEDYPTAYANMLTSFAVDPFFLAADTKVTDDVEDLFTLAGEESLFMVTSSSDVNTYNAVDETNIAYLLNNAAYENGLGFFSQDADTFFPEGALVGTWAATNPGTVTLHGADLTGVSADKLTANQAGVLEGRRFNYYTPVAGVNFYWNGYSPNGEFADLVRFKLWLEARVAEAVFALIKRNNATTGSKVPSTPNGEGLIYGSISEVLEQAYSRGATTLDENGFKYVITFPESQTSNDKANRLLNDVEFSVVYSSAVHKVVIRGYVTL